MIISASRRTDIPCYYSEWFMNRIHDGYVSTRNPMNYNQVATISLHPNDVDGIVFWTKDAQNMMDKLHVLDRLGYPYYFQFTLTPYDKSIETGLRDKSDIAQTFIDLSKMIGKSRMIWRYDPIILNDALTIAYHERAFQRLCEKLSNHASRVTISFVDMYKKIKSKAVREISENEMRELAYAFSEISKPYGLPVTTCCETVDLSEYGIELAPCIDINIIEKIGGHSLRVKKENYQRPGCICASSKDIGVYNTCKNGCVYCYANFSEASVTKNFDKHDPNGLFLL